MLQSRRTIVTEKECVRSKEVETNYERAKGHIWESKQKASKNNKRQKNEILRLEQKQVAEVLFAFLVVDVELIFFKVR